MVLDRMMRSRIVVLALLAAAILVTAVGTASAQQPSSVNPTASSVKEDELLRALKPEPGSTAAIAGRVSIPDKRGANLVQPQGRDWRAWHQETVPRVGAIAILGLLAGTVLFYLVRGRVRLSTGFSGESMTRFGFIERFAHWLTATSFIALALTGLNITFGKTLILPLVGPENFTALTQLGKFVHNYVSFAFALGVLLMFVLWVKDNLPHPRDLLWFLQGGGLIGSWHPAAARFNAGQKLIFWSVIVGGVALAISGYVMMFPFAVTDIGGQQLAVVVHALAGVILTAIIIGHIYIGSVGMEGAFAAMGSGKVDKNWAREHHSIWVERMEKKKSAAAPAAQAAPAE